MQYIRTKNAILKIVEQFKSPITDEMCYVSENSEIFYSYEIIDYADDIKVLCDEFVAVNDSMDLPILDSFENICLLLNTKKHKKDEVYGAIWTDKGLIYMAKLKKRRKLELL